MAKHALPVSRAKTAFGLLSEVRRVILAEPLRYDQNQYLLTREQLVYKRLRDGHPACGTVGCVAGWTCALKGQTRLMGAAVLNEAADILGIVDEAVANRFFHYEAVPMRAKVGAKVHAKRGAAHIASFQKKYAKQLRSKRV